MRVENHADYKGSAVSVSGSMAANFDTPFGEKGIAQSTKTKEDKAGNDVLTHGAESLQTGLVVGLGSDKDRQRSQTKSGINTANLVIRDEQAQLAKTGKTAEEAKAGLNTAITTDNAAAHSGKLENRFDKAKLQKELDYQVKATQEFQTITKPGIDGVMTQIAANKQAKAAALENAGDSQGAARLREEAKDWEMGGKYRQATDALTNALGLALGGKPTAGVIAGAASPYINQKIKEITQDMPKLNIPAHMIWGVIEAELQGGKAASGAISAGVGEAGATYLAQALYGTEKAESLTEAQKQHISTLSQFAAGVAGGLASAESAHSAGNNAAIGMGVAENAVEHNSLLVDRFRENKKADAEHWKENVREKLGNNTASQLINGVINVVEETLDGALFVLDGGFDVLAAITTCAVGDGYCRQAKQDVSGKNQAIADSLNRNIWCFEKAVDYVLVSTCFYFGWAHFKKGSRNYFLQTKCL